MESDSRFSYGGAPARPQQDQFVMMPVVHSTLAYPRTGVTTTTTAAAGLSPLDLASAIAHELRRGSSQPGWLAWNESTPGSQHYEAETIPYGAFLSPATGRQQQQQQQAPQLFPQYIPRYNECLQGPPAMLQRFDHSYVNTNSESESYASAQQEFYSRSGNGFASLHPTHQAFQAAARGDSGGSCSPWIERMLQSDVTPTPSPSGPSLAGTSSLQTSEPAISCVLSQTVDLQQSCHSNDMQQLSSGKSMRSAFSSDGPHAHDSSALESFSADLFTDDEDLETRPMDVKRRKRMLSNRASAQRSRQRRQERLDQLEVLTAQLRVENSTLQKKLSAATQRATKCEDLNKNLAKQVERLSKEGNVKLSPLARPVDECASSQQTTCASSCDMVSANPNGASSPSAAAVRKSPKKRSHDQLELSSGAFGVGSHLSTYRSLGCTASRPTRPTSPTGHGFATSAFLEPAIRPFSPLDSGLKVDDSSLDCLDSDRWFEFADCFM